MYFLSVFLLFGWGRGVELYFFYCTVIHCKSSSPLKSYLNWVLNIQTWHITIVYDTPEKQYCRESLISNLSLVVTVWKNGITPHCFVFETALQHPYILCKDIEIAHILVKIWWQLCFVGSSSAWQHCRKRVLATEFCGVGEVLPFIIERRRKRQ